MATPRLSGLRAALLWALLGVLFAFGALSLGWLALLPAFGLLAWFTQRLSRWPEALGLSTGAAVVLLGIAVHRARSPGLDPEAWMRAGLGLLGCSLLLYFLTRARPTGKPRGTGGAAPAA